MTKLFALFAAFTLSSTAVAFADPIPVAPTDSPVVKQDDGNVLMWEVPAKDGKPATPVDPDVQRKIDQAVYNETSYIQQHRQQTLMPPPSDGTAPGAITPPYLPYSTVPGGPYNVSGNVWTPFNNRSYSYGGNSQSFGAPMFYGNEIPNPALQYPAGYPLGGGTILPLMQPGRPAAPGMNPTTTPAAPPTTIPAPGGLAVPRTNILMPDND